MSSERNENASLISVGDVKLLLMAIVGIKGNKRMGIENPEETSKLQYGWINE